MVQRLLGLTSGKCGMARKAMTRRRPFDYAQLSLEDLIECIAYAGDAVALHELHQNRTPFRGQDGKRLHLAEFLDRLRQTDSALRLSGSNTEVVDLAYDLTLDKFHNLPPKGGGRRGGGSNCRYYFRAFLGGVQNGLAQGNTFSRPPDGVVWRNAWIAQYLRLKHMLRSAEEVLPCS